MWWPHSSYTEKNSFDKEIFFELLLYNIKKRIVVLTNIFIDRCFLIRKIRNQCYSDCKARRMMMMMFIKLVIYYNIKATLPLGYYPSNGI